MLIPAAAPLLLLALAAGPIDGAYRGTVGKLEVFARLQEGANGSLSGSYFYASRGRDLQLSGERRGARIDLVERAGGKATGRFSGAADGGTLAGKWRSGRRSLTFRLEAIPRGGEGPVLIATKDASRTVKLPRGGTFGGKECKVETTSPELFGLLDPEVEAELNRALRPEDEDCGDAGEHTRSFLVHLNRAGLLSLSLASYGFSEGAAHPYSETVSFNVWTRTGRTVRWDDLFLAGAAEAAKSRLDPTIRAAAANAEADASAADLLRNALAPPDADFFLEDKGIRLNPSPGLPQGLKALGRGDFFVPFEELRPWLARSGDAAKLWMP